MGRRPNPLMVEFFERGAKIGDSSNRYEQTCKRCGEHIQRGRSEAMILHLTKRCPAMSQAERTKIVLRLHDLAIPDVNPNIDPAVHPETGERDGSQGPRKYTRNNPFVQNRPLNFNGLNVLAEASRRVGGNPPDNTGYTPANEIQTGGPAHDNVPLDPQLQTDALAHSFTDHLLNDGGMGENNSGIPNFNPLSMTIHLPYIGFPTTGAASLPPLYPFMENGPPVTQDDLAGLPLVSTHSTDLSTIAATANATLDHGMMDDDMDISNDDVSSALLESLHENAFSSQDRPPFNWQAIPGTQPLEPSTMAVRPLTSAAQPTFPVLSFTGPEQALGEPPTQHLRPIAINPNSVPAHFVAESDDPPIAPKQKVRGRFSADRRQEVRMVRKAGACMRCRMLKKPCSDGTPCQTCAAVETPRLWKNSCVRTKLVDEFPLYFVGLYGAIVYHEVGELKKTVNVERIEGSIKAWHFTDQIFILKGLRGTPKDPEAEFPADRPKLTDNEVFVAELETDNILGKAERYLRLTCSSIIDQERSVVMKPTLQIAQTMKDAQQSNPTNEKHDNLISDIIELWIATSLLTDTRLKPQFVVDTGVTGIAIEEDSAAYSYHMLAAQLRAAVEKRASIICRAAMHHLEQRVLSRPKDSNFETFLVAFILLNCVERMSWLCRSWEHGAQPAFPWPLDHKPNFYAEKAQNLAHTIQMLLNIRQLEPKTYVDPETEFIMARNGNDTALAQWLTSVGFTRELAVQFGPATFDPYNSRSLDGLWSARLLQPQEFDD